MKTIIIKLTRASEKAGPFTIKDSLGNILETEVSRQRLIEGISYPVQDSVSGIVIQSTGKCTVEQSRQLTLMSQVDLSDTHFTQSQQSCLWRHLTDMSLYNSFYGQIEPYILEHPFSYQYQDQIVQSVSDHSKVYKYEQDNELSRTEHDDKWFNQIIVYTNQQSSGVMELIPKPKNNLSAYLKYPLYNPDSRTVCYAKTDSVYQVNGFFDIAKDHNTPMFKPSCENLSLDKTINQENMNYSHRSFKKPPIRGKDCKVRYCLNNRSDINIVSQLIVQNTQISYK